MERCLTKLWIQEKAVCDAQASRMVSFSSATTQADWNFRMAHTLSYLSLELSVPV